MKKTRNLFCLLAAFVMMAATGYAREGDIRLPLPAKAAAGRLELGRLVYDLPEGRMQELTGQLGQIKPEAVGIGSGSAAPVASLRFAGGEVCEIYRDGVVRAAGVDYTVRYQDLEAALRAVVRAAEGRAPEQVFGTQRKAAEVWRAYSGNGLYYADVGVEPLQGIVMRADGDLGERLGDLGRLEVRDAGNGWKTRYELYENGVRMTHTYQGMIENAPAASGAWTFTKGYAPFLQSLRASYAGAPKGPAWFGIVNPYKIEGTADLGDGAGERNFGADAIEGALSGVRVRGAGAGRFDALPELTGARRVAFTFAGGIRYGIIYNDKAMTITSSDVPGGIFYQLEGACSLDDLRIDADYKSKPDPGTGKPVIYLYPEREQEVNVRLDFTGDVTYAYPAYGKDGWTVTASPDGRLTGADGGEYYYLFWEGTASVPWECEKGACVAGGETEAYLRKTLAQMGLTPREYNDFITYWVPRMRDNPYNLISFSETQYDEVAKLTVTPAPDSVLRVHMVWKGLDRPVTVEPQRYEEFERRGFTVVEWGGTEID